MSKSYDIGNLDGEENRRLVLYLYVYVYFVLNVVLLC